MAESEQMALYIKDVHAHYGASHILHGVTIQVPAGQVTSIVGRNGVGKTTLINCIMGLIPATNGSVRLGSIELLQQPAYQRQRLGLAIVPQGRRVFPSLTVDEHLDLVKTKRESAFSREWIFSMFPRLKERHNAMARQLSGGEQSMLAIARALTTAPSILLMDEPTEGLAPLLVEGVGELVMKLRAVGLTVLLVEQNLAFALKVADRLAVMERGVIVRACGRDEIGDVEALSDLILAKGSQCQKSA